MINTKSLVQHRDAAVNRFDTISVVVFDAVEQTESILRSHPWLHTVRFYRKYLTFRVKFELNMAQLRRDLAQARHETNTTFYLDVD